MGLFDHRHYWRPVTGLNTVVDPQTGKATLCLMVEECTCGLVRTIEYAPGQAPVIRMGVQK